MTCAVKLHNIKLFSSTPQSQPVPALICHTTVVSEALCSKVRISNQRPRVSSCAQRRSLEIATAPLVRAQFYTRQINELEELETSRCRPSAGLVHCYLIVFAIPDDSSLPRSRSTHISNSMTQPQGIGGALKSSPLHPSLNGDSKSPSSMDSFVETAETLARPGPIKLENKAGESKSPYVRAHATNPVAWQIWSEETIALARRENRPLFVSIGYSACHCKFAECDIGESKLMISRVSRNGARILRKRRNRYNP